MKVRIFTDGACSGNPGPGGWGVIFNAEDRILKFSGNEQNTTNNRMELKAVIKAMENILEFPWKRPNDFILYSDSAYVVNAIEKSWLLRWRMQGWKTTKGEDIKNQDLWKAYIKYDKKIKLQEGVSFEIRKVKGHNGNTFNDLVDEIAKKEVLKVKEGKLCKETH